MKLLSEFKEENQQLISEISWKKAAGHFVKAAHDMHKIRAAHVASKVMGIDFDRTQLARRAINRNVGTNSSAMRMLGMKGKSRADANKSFKFHKDVTVRDYVTTKWNARLGTKIPAAKSIK